MAFAGLHAVAGYKGGYGFRKTPSTDGFHVTASQSVSSATLSTLVAPDFSLEFGQPWMRLYAAADSWVSIGAAPDQTADPRFLVKATTVTDVAVQPGDKIKWVAA